MNFVAVVMLTIGAAGFVYRLLRGPSLPDRVVGLDGLLSVIVIGIIVIVVVMAMIVPWGPKRFPHGDPMETPGLTGW